MTAQEKSGPSKFDAIHSHWDPKKIPISLDALDDLTETGDRRVVRSVGYFPGVCYRLRFWGWHLGFWGFWKTGILGFWVTAAGNAFWPQYRSV